MTPYRIVVMGVSAAGKSSVGAELARTLGVPFVDADALHPPANIAKMAAGEALDDEDRWPWLAAVADALDARTGVVVACSALKRRYRDRLRQGVGGVEFIHLTGLTAVLEERALHRTGHFMPPALLRSQLDALEPLEDDEAGCVIDIDAPVTVIAQRALEWVRAGQR